MAEPEPPKPKIEDEMLEGLFMLLAALTAQAGPDPLAPARADKVQCYSPNVATRTCLAMSSYAAQAGGAYSYTTRLMLSPSPLWVIETRGTLTLEGGAACNLVRREEVKDAELTSDGVAMPARQAAQVIDQLVALYEPMVGKKACTRYRPDGDVLVAEIDLDGVAHPELTKRLIWVGSGDGYHLGR